MPINQKPTITASPGEAGSTDFLITVANDFTGPIAGHSNFVPEPKAYLFRRQTGPPVEIDHFDMDYNSSNNKYQKTINVPGASGVYFAIVKVDWAITDIEEERDSYDVSN